MNVALSAKHLWLEMFTWLSANSAAHATVMLVAITGIYTVLNWRMARAISQQTRSQIMPVISLSVHWTGEAFHPNGSFRIKNLGSLPIMLLDIRLGCHSGTKHVLKEFRLWDRHLLGPGESLSPIFDLRAELSEDGIRWERDGVGYSIRVVAADVGEKVVMTYTNLPVLSVFTHAQGIPLSVRWRYFKVPFRIYAYRLKNYFKKN